MIGQVPLSHIQSRLTAAPEKNELNNLSFLQWINHSRHDSLIIHPSLPMAPTLSSNSFLLTTTIPPSRTALSNHHYRPPTLFAKKSDDQPLNSTPFRFDFDFTKLPDVTSLVPVVSNPSSGLSFRRKDPGTVFVAGATGQAGIRIAQTLLRQGFSVRAGVPDLAAAQELALLAAQYKVELHFVLL